MQTNLSNPFIPYYSATYSRQYLTDHYDRLNIPQPSSKGYQACYSFIYHLQHGQLYLEQALQAPIGLKPVLLFYGLIQLIKGCVLTANPDYPENSHVLAHGVSTRKRKKSSYSFLNDEVKTQKDGLFPHFLKKMFHMEHLPGQKYNMQTLLQHIPDMECIFLTVHRQNLFFKGELKGDSLTFSSSVLDHYHMTPNRFEQYLESCNHSGYDPKKRIHEKDKRVHIPLSTSLSPIFSSPWLFNEKGAPYLLKNRANENGLPELAVHYLLLYNLSMISRYETEWWGELTHTFDGTDYPFIHHYLNTAQTKIPKIISLFLKKNGKAVFS